MTADRPPLAEGIPDRLYGRRRGHPLRPRQQLLLDATLPRLRLSPAQARDPRAAFAAPVEALWLEVGFGGGEHALAHVEANPQVGYIASEVFENGLCSLLTRLVPEGEEATGALPGNLRLWPQDARHLLGLLPEGCLDRLMLMFPDPWPKSRHAKRRFVNPSLLPLVARVLRPGGEWRIASDDPTYQAWVEEVFAATDLFTGAPPAAARPEGWPGTRYEAKALREGRQPLYWVKRRV
ncbi:tRNA (guanine(46)-N(7))-methyltransferase TrmB [Siccirubricoccus sp. KC 17139]|uniref:tRNA (guanine-N(7)-)-methyltransferase n=1 Tax=Siccirubricoccus soli TaxID=2899147 RepID=A0ABT1DEX2_9PROT|nr:tRNA (guanine(46)-N(7))-methyltransferase TrmB [Siccirubricoccus soli]MCO6419770.1 tRNA (guanine(46)-N(7))-methyltransferase TrmB [Siccirubricoccus soli]MCP2685905.1 tRNA (guanine(46)-N(7))-methyltransferase TrmB [Siccirubricoccus soli]